MTMHWIASSVPSVGSQMVEFLNIPQDYEHLELRYFIKGSDSGGISYMNIAVNTEYYGPTNYAQHTLAGQGSSVFTENYTNIQSNGGLYSPGGGSATGVYAAGVTQILDYKNTNKFKTFKNMHGYDANGSGYIMLNSGLWRSTAAINKVHMVNMTFVANCRIDLYGITSNPIATGA